MKKGTKFVYKLGENLYINLTNKCCNNCTFCLRNSGEGVTETETLWLEREPSAKEIIKLINETAFDYDEAVFCGYGESTYKLDEMKEVAEFLKSIGKITRLNTNGLGNLIHNRDIAKDLAGKIDKVSVSLNESSAERYDEICRSIYGKKAFDAVLEFAVKCKNNGIETNFSVVDMIGSEAVEECKKVAKKADVPLKVRKFITDNVSYN